MYRFYYDSHTYQDVYTQEQLNDLMATFDRFIISIYSTDGKFNRNEQNLQTWEENGTREEEKTQENRWLLQ